MDRNAINRIAQRINMQEAVTAKEEKFKEFNACWDAVEECRLKAAKLEAHRLQTEAREAQVRHEAQMLDWERARNMVAEVDRRAAVREAGERHKASGWSKKATVYGTRESVTVTPTKEEPKMSQERTIRMNAMLSGFDRVAIHFESSPKQYHYRAPRSMKVKAGDLVIVDSPYSGMTMATVDFVDRTLNPVRPYRYKQIVGKVDVQAYYDRCEAEVKLEEALDAMEAQELINSELAALQESMTADQMDEFTKLVEAAKGRVK